MLVCRRALAAATCRLACQFGVARISAARCMQHNRMQQVAGWLADHLQFACTSALLALPLTMTLPLACDVFISAIFFPLFLFFTYFFRIFFMLQLPHFCHASSRQSSAWPFISTAPARSYLTIAIYYIAPQSQVATKRCNLLCHNVRMPH